MCHPDGRRSDGTLGALDNLSMDRLWDVDSCIRTTILCSTLQNHDGAGSKGAGIADNHVAFL